MKRVIAMLMLVLACCLFVTAQSEQTGAANFPMTMTGCVAEKDGKYMMMNKEHPEGVQLMSSDDMKPHVGHEMQVTGMMEKMSGASADSMKSDDTMKSGMKMKVTKMKMMSEKCDASE